MGNLPLYTFHIAGVHGVSGWYNVIDFTGKVRGQIHVAITVSEESKACLECLAEQQEKSEENTGGHSRGPMPPSTEEPRTTHWVMPEPAQPASQLLPPGDTQSALAAKLSDLDSLSNRLREKLSFDQLPQLPAADSETLYYSTLPAPPSVAADRDTPVDDEGSSSSSSLAAIQAKLAGQLEALKTQLLGQAARLQQHGSDSLMPDLGNDIDFEAAAASTKSADVSDEEETDINERSSRRDPDGGRSPTLPH